MRIFVLDDMQERHDSCHKKFPEAEITSIFDAVGAIAHLESHLDEYDLICLDHDLGGQIFVDMNEENTGSTVAKFLSDKMIKCPIVIHSLNFWGAQNMLHYLPKAIYIPFFFEQLNRGDND
jgi:hypothetical protein